jgi:cephalosporin-C deacetylase
VPLTDLPLDTLRDYRPDVLEPEDFDEFWAATLDQSRALAWAPRLERVESPLRTVEIYDVTFAGYLGQPIRAWLTVPADAVGPLPTIVEYQGYNGGRGLPGERLFWASAGYSHFFMDTRGQGSGWGTGGHTPDPDGSDASAAGWMTRGILDPETYYYRRVFTDAVLAIDAAGSLPQVDGTRVSVAGGSQGGGIALAAGALVPDVCAVMPDVPFLCHFRRGAEITGSDPFTEITRYLSVHRGAVERVFSTLSYFDGVNFARRATAPALFSAALMDDVVPPSTIFAAFNRYAGPAAIEVYPFNGHESGQLAHTLTQATWLPQHLRAATVSSAPN